MKLKRTGEKVFDIRDFGADGTDDPKNWKAVRKAVKAAEKNGGIVYLPPTKPKDPLEGSTPNG